MQIIKSLKSQTKGTATADCITDGKTAWVNGEKITGTYVPEGGAEMVKVSIRNDSSETFFVSYAAYNSVYKTYSLQTLAFTAGKILNITMRNSHMISIIGRSSTEKNFICVISNPDSSGSLTRFDVLQTTDTFVYMVNGSVINNALVTISEV